MYVQPLALEADDKVNRVAVSLSVNGMARPEARIAVVGLEGDSVIKIPPHALPKLSVGDDGATQHVPSKMPAWSLAVGIVLLTEGKQLIGLRPLQDISCLTGKVIGNAPPINRREQQRERQNDDRRQYETSPDHG